MRPDMYLRAVLTVIAAALVYLCIVLTPLPSASAQARTPGELVNVPRSVEVIGWRLPPNQAVAVVGDVRVTNSPLPVTAQVTGRVQTTPADQTVWRTVIAGWEENGATTRLGRFQPLDSGQNQRGIPVTQR